MAKTVIITGSSRGIGAATAILFAKKGFNVVIQGRNKEKLQQVKEKCEKNGAAGVLEVEMELSNTQGEIFWIKKTCLIQDLPQLVNETVEKFGGLDVLVNNAALGTIGCNLENTTAEMMDAVLNVNIKAPILITQAAMPHLKKTRGAIVNVSSMVSHVRTNS